jgi:hypothetical protein
MVFREANSPSNYKVTIICVGVSYLIHIHLTMAKPLEGAVECKWNDVDKESHAMSYKSVW